MTEEQRVDAEQAARVAAAVREADARFAATEATFEEAYQALATLAREMGFPLTRSLRPEERSTGGDT